jgi:DNA-binding response OmpR family regulator
MKRILVADDTKNIRTLIKTCLELDNYEVDVASDGQQAFDLLSKNKYDLAFLDIKMPIISGTEVLRKLRCMGNSTPVIIITAFATVKNAIDCTKMGAVAYLQKPFTADKIRTVLEEIKIQEDETNKFEYLLRLVRTNIEENELDEAFNNAKTALSIYPNSNEVYFLISKIYEGKNDTKLAEKYLSISKMFTE